MNMLSKSGIGGVCLLMVSSLAFAADAAMPNLKVPPAEASAKPQGSPAKDAPKAAGGSASDRWSKNQEDLSILKQELEIRELQKKISAAEQFGMPAPVILPSQMSDMPKAGVASDAIYVDRVFGVDGVLQARVFFDSHIMTVGVNDEIADGIVVTNITSKGITVRSGRGRPVDIPLTTTSTAAARAFPSGVVMGVTGGDTAAPLPAGMRQLPPGAFPASVLGLQAPPPISTGP